MAPSWKSASGRNSRRGVRRGAAPPTPSKDISRLRERWSAAVAALEQGRFAEARSGFLAVASADPANIAARHNFGVACQGLGRWQEAARAWGRALVVDAQAHESRFALAGALAILGRLEEAAGEYRHLAALPSERTRALSRLGILTSALTDDEVEILEAAGRDEAAPLEVRSDALFALAPALEARVKLDQAFAAFSEANRLRREALGGAVEAAARAHARSVALQKARFDAPRLGRPDPAANPSPAPIFIVGFPRSGSSLIEHILASHPEVQGLGETGALGAALDVGGSATDYLGRVRTLGWNGKSRFTDKTLENFLHVGWIAQAFPSAVIIESRREAMDVAFACWRQRFAEGAETLYDFADIAAELRRHEEMMAHWKALLPGLVREARLEALIAEPEAEIRRLVIEVCGLPWNEACLRPHLNRRPVASASVAQVREPITGAWLGRWMAYGDRLEPLRSALAPR
ncbi:MAG: sulfotransferase [Caulobacteraceae bacterium]